MTRTKSVGETVSPGNTLVIATANEGKFREFRSALGGSGLTIRSAAEVGVTSFPPESGTTYQENAMLKAAHVAVASGLPALGDDSGLEVDALDGAPGVYSARFGGALSPGERIAHVLAKIRKVPEGERGARFVCSLVLATPAGAAEAFEGSCRGRILQGPRGASGFGYDPVFYSEDLGKTFAEATDEEKRSVSHRGRAIAAFVDWLQRPGAREMLASASADGEAP